ncbi:MAG: DUF3696 domain-containing protein [Planctomycetota bacterium]|nr:DUF3696 domain-containing protein [Planctomycetota bacterium]
MTKSLSLGQFKAFGKTQTIPIKPLTLIFGPNSAGKSSIIHSLALMHEAWIHGDLDPSYTQLGGSSIDLGGFKQYIHRGETSREIEWSISLTIQKDDWIKEITIQWRFGVALDDKGKPLKGAKPLVSSLEVDVNGKRLLRFNKQREYGLAISNLDTGHGLVQRIVKECQLELNSGKTHPVDTSTLTLIDDLVGQLTSKGSTVFPTSLVLNRDGISGANRNGLEPEAQSFQLLFVQKLNAAFQELRAEVADFFQSAKYLGPLRSLPQRRFEESSQKDSDWNASGSFAWEAVKRDKSIRDKVNMWLGSENRLKTPYELKLESYIPESLMRERFLGEDVLTMLQNSWTLETEEAVIDREHWLSILREEPPKYFEFLPDTLQNFIQSFPDEMPSTQRWHNARALIENHTDFIAKQLDAIVWTKEQRREAIVKYYGDSAYGDFWDELRFTSSEELALQLFDEDFPDRIEELILIDKKRGNTRVSHRDVGIGISQVLPVLVHAFGAKNSLVAIEQPEIHIHPALQAELGDVFIESALGEQNNTFLIETHSEHLVLRLLRRIRECSEGSSPDGLPQIRPEDVSIIYVNPDENGAQVIEIPIDEDGEFTRRWPHGFFVERREELF